jgi:hypothetical protein
MMAASTKYSLLPTREPKIVRLTRPICLPKPK